MDISEYSDDDLKQLMEKYKEKKMRYDLMFYEATVRTERIVLNIHLETSKKNKQERQNKVNKTITQHKRHQ
jgi:hypothetical protein